MSRAALKGHATRIVNQFRLLLDEHALPYEDVAKAQHYLDTYKARVSTIERKYEEEIDSHNTSKADLEKLTTEYDEFLDASLERETEMVAAINAAKAAKQAAHPQEVKAPSYQFRLNELKINTYEGKGSPAEFYKFKASFEAALAGVGELADRQKLLYLKTKLGGTALSLVAPLSVSDDNYRLAWAQLEATFADRDLAISMAIKGLLSAKGVSSERDPGKVLEFLHEVRAVLLTLLDLGLDFGVANSPGERLLSEVVAQKLPHFFVLEVKRIFKKSVPLVSDYLDRAGEILRMFEDRSSQARPPAPSNPNAKTQSKTSGKPRQPSATAPRPPARCKFCVTEGHTTFRCGGYGTPPVRLQRAHDLNLCTKCLAKHPTRDCRVKLKPCFLCSSTGHVAALCEKFVPSK